MNQAWNVLTNLNAFDTMTEKELLFVRLMLFMGRYLNRIFLGGNKVLQIALGKTEAEEQKEGLHKASEVDFFMGQSWMVNCNIRRFAILT